MPAQLVWVIQSSRATCCITFYPDKFEDIIVLKNQLINSIQDAPFWNCSWMRGGGGGGRGAGLHISYKDENSHGYNRPKEDPKIYKPRGDTPLCSAKIIRNQELQLDWEMQTKPEISNFSYIVKYIQKLSFDTFFLIFLPFIKSLQVVLITMIAILIKSVKLASLGFLETKVIASKLLSFTPPAIFY